jgi:peroxiredoxin Q/BCP
MGLKIGDNVPFFTSVDSFGNNFEIRDYIGNPLVIYFYPKDYTPGCTTQACGFRDQYQDFKDLGAEIIGISSDNIESHTKFKDKYNLPFILLSDENKSIRKMFGVSRDYIGLIDGRTTFIVDKKGIIQFVFDSISAKNHIEKALKIVQELTK